HTAHVVPPSVGNRRRTQRSDRGNTGFYGFVWDRGDPSAQSPLESRVVAYGGEVVVSACVLPELRPQLDRAPQVGERLVARVTRKRGEARVVVIQPRVVRHVLEGAADRLLRVGIPLLAVGLHGLVVERPGVAPVDALVGLARSGADDEPGSL